jgi:Fur family ferric uptake transcriptional regulator
MKSTVKATSTRMLTRLNESGVRLTASRKAVVTAIAQAGKPLTPETVFERARKLHPGVGLATVYRTLDALQAARCTSRVYVDQQAYVIACFESSLHAHLLCSQCHGLTECDLDEVAPGIQKALAAAGFRPSVNVFEMVGLCGRCQRA